MLNPPSRCWRQLLAPAALVHLAHEIKYSTLGYVDRAPRILAITDGSMRRTKPFPASLWHVAHSPFGDG